MSTYNYCSQASVRKWINRGRLHDTCRAEMHGVKAIAGHVFNVL